MVGLGVVLEEAESTKYNNHHNNNTLQVINKTTMMLCTTSNPFKVSSFLQQCFLCNKKLLSEKDIYMYKGDKAFCSVDCRCKQILTDEEEAIQKQKCS
ncbi:unnamed protein product [Lathyrus sativus]|nr:unnamed protein product [Lathyrus sativus]